MGRHKSAVSVQTEALLEVGANEDSTKLADGGKMKASIIRH